MKFVIHREPSVPPMGGAEGYTLGKMYSDGLYICNTLEDEDRFLESGGEKVYGRTAIPRGRYKVVLDFSEHFQKQLPHVLDVPGYEGVRIHGGNRAEDSLGCILVGKVRTATGIAQCLDMVGRIIALIESDEARGTETWLEVV